VNQCISVEPLCQLVLQLTDTKLSQHVNQRQILTQSTFLQWKQEYKGHRMTSLLLRDHRMWSCGHCQAEKAETKEHFLFYLHKKRHFKSTKLQIYILNFADIEHKDNIAIFLGEGPSAALEAQMS
jgi:hypothetical protein